MIVLDKSILGTSKYLCQSSPGDDLSWCDIIPPSSWLLSYNHGHNFYDLSDAAKIFNIDIPSIVSASQAKAMAEVGVADIAGLPWHMITRKDDYQKCVSNILETLWHVIEALSSAGYSNTNIIIDKFLGGMKRASIDTNILASHKCNETNPTILSSLATFDPDILDNMSKPVVYDRTATSTGRLTITSGPRILTLPTRCRDIITSRYSNGEILQIDFVSIEPRIALMLGGISPPDDVYSFIAKELFSDKLERAQVKMATLCVLYGISEYRLKKMLGDEFRVKQVIKGIKEFFGFEKQVSKLRNEILENGHMQNALGRPIFLDNNEPDHIIFNHFIQSTAAEASIVGFCSLFDKIMLNKMECQYLFLIHDALVVDVEAQSIGGITKLCRDGINISGLGNFPVEIKALSDNME